jgi:hypothetical protein
MVEAGFYIASEGRITDKTVGLLTCSKYSHVELIIDGLAYSSSMRDGGVRAKQIEFKPERWDFVRLHNVNEKAIETFYKLTKDAKYDYYGATVNQVMKIEKPMWSERWYCSEWIATALSNAGDYNLEEYISMNKLYYKLNKDSRL